MARLIYISVLYCLICCCSSQNSDTATDEVLPDGTSTINVDQLEAPPPGISIVGLGPEVPSETPDLQVALEPPETFSSDTVSEGGLMEPLPDLPAPTTTQKPRITGGPLPPIPGCPKNEVQLCVSPACPRERTCRNRYGNILCRAGPPCAFKCVCKLGYLRTDYGVCVPAAQCDRPIYNPSVEPLVAATSSGGDSSPYEDREGPLRSPQSIPPPDGSTWPPVNVDGAISPPGDDTTLPQPSPSQPVDIDRHPPPLPVLPNCYGPTEIVKCVGKCPPERTCRNRNVLYRCPRIKDRCTYKCVCKPGYFRNSIGQCITEAQCKQCSKPHEHFTCGGACDNVCSTIKFANQTNCPTKYRRCVERCYCDPGYARDSKGNCIPISKCPPSCDSPDEEYVRSRSCPPDTCLSLVARFKCNSKEKPKYRCRCKSGYLRPKAGAPCVPICLCPQMANSPDCADSLLT